MLNKEEKLNLLQKLLETDQFKSSNSYKNLLTYLVNSSIQNKKLKEYSIAIDVFNKGTDFNPAEDSSVRVYVSNLRKKLDHYYTTEGKKDEYRIVVPLGHYNLDFISFANNEDQIKESKWKKLFFTIVPLLIIAIVYLTFENFNRNKNTIRKPLNLKQNFIWHNWEENNLPKMLILGNDLFYLETIDNEETIVRKHDINLQNDYNSYKSTHPEKKIIDITPYPFFPLINVSLIPIFSKTILVNTDFILKNSMETNSKDILNNDIIFLGSFRNLHFLNFLLEDSLIIFSNDPKNLFVQLSDKDSSFIFTQAGQAELKHVDYCLFRKIPGPNKNTIYLFISFFQAGISGAVNYTLYKSHLSELENLFTKKYGNVPQYFDVVFKSIGHSRTAFTTSIEYIHKIDSNNLSIW